MKYFLFVLIAILVANRATAQTDPLPVHCEGPIEAEGSAPFLASCAKTSTLWSSNARHVPNPNARSIRVRANFIVLQKIDGTGNFQDIPEHRAFLDDWFNRCNERLANLWGTSNCSPLVTDAKVQIVPNWIFLPDPDPTEFNWNNDNNPGGSECPNTTTWWLNGLDAVVNSNTAIPRGINVYLTVDGSVYNELVVLGTIDNPQQNNMAYVWCSEHPSSTNLSQPSRISISNLFLKYWWFQNHPDVIGVPFSTSREWIVAEGSSLAHEFGHSFISCYVHKSGCSNHLMTASGGTRNVLLEDDAGCIHRNLAISNLRQFVDCDQTYNPSNTPPSSTDYDRVVTNNELWDINMRLYSNVTVRAGTTLTVSCKLLMPQGGLIKVERGAKLIVDGGTVMRANTCLPTQYWGAISVAGNNAKIQPIPTATLATDDAGVVILKNQGILEGAVLGVTTQRIPGVYEPQYWGAVVDVNDFTFRDCRKGVEFMKYDFPNRSKFNKATFTRTATGSSYAGVSIWDTDGILFEECTFANMAQNGLITWDAIFNVKQKNRFSGSPIAILAGASAPLSGQIQVGVLGLQGSDRNNFENNVVGIRATANSKVEIFSNNFENSNFDITINGTTQSAITDNAFAASAAGNQFESTGDNSNQNLCNTYSGNTVGTNIVGKNTGFLFRQEDYSTVRHDLFIEGLAIASGEIQVFQGQPGAARWNYFSAGKPENIKTSTVVPNNNTIPFWYFHPDPAIDARLKPKCPLNETCVSNSNFYNLFTGGGCISNCLFPAPPENPPCATGPCLESVRLEIAQKTAQYGQNPTDALKGELQLLVTQREFITDEIIRQYRGSNDWASVEALLNEDLNPANRRRLVGAKLEQQQHAAAAALLQAFPQNTSDDQYFVQVQVVNVARLSDPEFALSGAQEASLLAIAEAPTPEAGYAQALLGILTGRVFMPKLPELDTERSVAPNKAAIPLGIEVMPNPASDVIQLRFMPSAAQQTIDLRSLATGAFLQSVDVSGQDTLALPVRHLPSGMYLFVLREQGRVVAYQKVVVQH